MCHPAGVPVGQGPGPCSALAAVVLRAQPWSPWLAAPRDEG